MAHPHNPSLYQAGAEELQARVQPRLHSVTLSERVGGGKEGEGGKEGVRRGDGMPQYVLTHIHTVQFGVRFNILVFSSIHPFFW